MPAFGEYEKALAGMKAGFNGHAEGVAAKTVIEFGDIVFGVIGEDNTGYADDKLVLNFSADFVASNVINATFNGVAISPVTYATSHAATFDAVIAAIDAIPGVVVTGANSTTRVATISIPGARIVSSVVVTAGASQATAFFTTPSDRFVRGIALFVQKQKTSEALGARYEIGESVSVLKSGLVWVPVTGTATSGSLVGLDNKGGFANAFSASAALLSGADSRFKTSAAAGELATISINVA